MNKVSLSFNLVFIFSLLAISMVESSPTLDDLPQMTGADTAEASSSMDAESILMNDDNEASVIDQQTKPVTFVDTIPIIMNVDDTNTACMIENKDLLTDKANQIILGSVKITIITDGGKVTKVTDSSGSTGTDTAESEDIIEQSVPGGIGGSVFFGKAISGSSETFNMSENDFYNQIFQTMNKEVFVVGRFAKLADTANNRMVLAKFDKEETNTDTSVNGQVKGNYYKY